jgi:hypothetical protein
LRLKPTFSLSNSLLPHFLRRANITWWQEVGGSSIETSKIAGVVLAVSPLAATCPRL